MSITGSANLVHLRGCADVSVYQGALILKIPLAKTTLLQNIHHHENEPFDPPRKMISPKPFSPLIPIER
jgi:hypothetical protein